MRAKQELTAQEQIAVLADLYSDRAEAYDSLWSPVIQPLGERLIDRMPLARAVRVIDVGTGSGALLQAIQRAAPKATVVGVDRSEGMLRLARVKHPGPLEVMDAQHLKFADGVFDAAVAAFVLFHLPEPGRCLTEVHRILRPGGTVGAITWATEEFPPANTVWDEQLEVFGAKAPALPATDNRASCNTPGKMTALLREAGFEDVQVWIESVEHDWRPEDSFDYHVRSTARARLQTLDARRRKACLVQVRRRLASLGADGYLFRGTVIMSLGGKPAE